MSGTIRVGLVDDQALFRAGIRMLVSSQPDLEFVGEAGNGVDGIAMAANAMSSSVARPGSGTTPTTTATP